MKRLLLLSIILFTLLVAIAAFFAYFQKGLDAARNEDFATVGKWGKPLAEQGNAESQFHLGWMYERGRGVPQDDKTAVKWWTLAAEQGHANSQSNLGFMYERGRGVPQDFRTAVKWYKLAAEQGYAPAQYNLGWMYAYVDGTLKNYIYAHMWGSLAAANGNEKGGQLRDDIAKKMTPADISIAQRLARECVKKNYKGC